MVSNPSLFGIPYKVVALVTLVVQNSLLTILLHYSRINVEPSKMYSAASAVLLNELLKGFVSFSIAFSNAVHAAAPSSSTYHSISNSGENLNEKGGRRNSLKEDWKDVWEIRRVWRGVEKMRQDIFSPDCWKLSIPACLYVIQNNLQFVAASNLSVPTFQVSYNLKILTTALFSVLLLKRKLSPKKWTGLFFLAVGVGIVQIQSISSNGGGGSKHTGDEMNQAKGLLAVASACMTSGLAGVYFEMVLKGSKTDLWIRNCQLSFFSMLPALLPVFLPTLSLFSSSSTTSTIPSPGVFANFGFWAWAVVITQVVGGLVTALVIKYSDNIVKGFATSLAIVLSFLAGVILFDFQVTISFLVGTIIVIGATYLFTAPESISVHQQHQQQQQSRSSSIFNPNAPSPLFPIRTSLDYNNNNQHPPFSPTSAHYMNNTPPTSALSALRSYTSGTLTPPTHRRIPTSGNLTPEFNTPSGFGILESQQLHASQRLDYGRSSISNGSRNSLSDHTAVNLSDTDYVGDPGRKREESF